MPSKKLGLMVLAATALGLAACGPSSSSVSSSSNKTVTSSASESTTVASSTTSTSIATSTSTSSPSSSSQQNDLNIAYADDTFVYGGAGDAGTGRFVYWAGDGGSVASATKTDGKYTFSYTSAGQWYGVQAFYKLPYAEVGDSYQIKMSLTSDIAGKMTINGGAVDLIAGTVDYQANFAQAAGNTIELQLGIIGTPLAGHSLSFTTPVIVDKTAGANYHEIKFMNGETTAKQIEVKHGKTVTAPADPAPAQGYIFDGWFAGETAFDSKVAVNAAATYTAKFINESEVTRYTVTFMNGGTVLGTTQIVKGKTVVVPALVLPFGYTVGGWYSDAGLATAWNLASATVQADITLYAKLLVTPSATFMNTGDTGWKIPDINIFHNDDGSLKISGFAGWGAASWVVQVNFAPVPKGDAGKTYKLSFEYKINGNGADAQIYDGATVGSLVNLTTTSTWTKASISFAGGSLSTNNKFTFELGAIPASVASVDFELTNIVLAAI